jgi:hypothetical protein
MSGIRGDRMVRRIFATALAAALTVGTLYAAQAPAAPARQEKPALTASKPPAPAPTPPKPPAPEGLPSNIRIEVTITDQAGPGEAAKRTVSMIVADRKNAYVRSSGQVQTTNGRFNVALNVDASPTIVKDGLMRLDLSLEYSPKPGAENASSGEGRSPLNERLSLMVESGKPLTISQASDPTSDRKMTVELTATILK